MTYRAMALLLLPLLGCSAGAVWLRPGATQQDFARDSYECERDVRMAAAGAQRSRPLYDPSPYAGYTNLAMGTNNLAAVAAEAVDAQGFYERCMFARGYVKQE